jgi:hypothetical protein
MSKTFGAWNMSYTRPSPKERQEYWLWCYASEAFRQVIASWDFLEKSTDSLPADVRSIISAGILVTYAKPFLRCHGVGCLPDTVIPKHLRTVHSFLIELRHKTMAHLDASNFQAPKGGLGNILQLRLFRNSGTWDIAFIKPSENILRGCRIRELTVLLFEKAEYHVDKFTRKYVEKLNLPKGEYVLSLNPNDIEPFISAPPLKMKAPAGGRASG